MNDRPVARASDRAAHARSQLVGMEAAFLADFASGRMGRHHNTFQHRSRVLRQLHVEADEGRSRRP